jgi:hypothetical protein
MELWDWLPVVSNVFAIQLQALAHRLDQGCTDSDWSMDSTYGAFDESEHLVSRLSNQRQALTPQTLKLAHYEFRCRQDVIAIGLHRRVVL